MPKCECGCGEEALNYFKPGHDQKLRAALENRVGGLLSLKDLVEGSEALANGSISELQFSEIVKNIFKK